MAAYESYGFCPYNTVTTWCFSQEAHDCGKEWLYGLWRVFGGNVVFAPKKDNGGTDIDVKCLDAFTTDPIAENLMMGIVRANANATKVLVRQLHNGAMNTQELSDVQKVIAEASAPKLIAKPESRFLAVIDNVGDEITVWLWDLDSTY